MSLCIWLPLNGDIRQQGLVDWNPTLQSGTTASYVDGKIGKALNTGGIAMPDTVTAQVLNNDAYSYACWIYVNGATDSTSERAMIFGNNDQTGHAGGRQFSLFQYPNANDLHWSWYNYDGTNYAIWAGSVLYDVLPSYTWTHIAVTYGNNTAKIYINGELQKTFTGTSNAISFEYNTTLVHNSPYHYLNDIRLYDHCLSVKEVKELAKGLMLHYKLSGLAENICPATYASTEWRSLVLTDGTNKCITLWTSPFIDAVALGLSVGDIVQVSFDIKFSEDITETGTGTSNVFVQGSANNGASWGGLSYTATGCGGSQKANIQAIITSDSKQGHINTWFIVTSAMIDGTYTGKIHSNIRFDYYTGTVYVRNVKVEVGSKATPWCPFSSDSLYSALGFNDGIEYDCSGFGNNATKTNNVTISSDTPRHLGSYYFDGNKSWYQMDRPLYDYYNNDFSISVWLKPTDSTRSVIISEYGGSGASNVAFELKATRQLRLYWNGSPDIGTTQSLTLNEWSHCVITKKDNTFKFYINGEMIQSYTNSSDLSSRVSNGYPRIGDDYRGNSANTVSYMGYMSDFRMYTTCLSDDDVLELYNVSASVDNNGGLYAYEVVEQ